MRKGTSLCVPAGAVLLSVCAVVHAADELEGAETPISFSGYNKTLLISSRTVPERESYELLLNRLRLKLSYRPSPHFQAHVEEDITARAGSYLDTAAFNREKIVPDRQYWGDGSSFIDKPGFHGMQQLFRGYVRLSGGQADLTVGRQRIPLGTGRLWSTLDMLNPANPVQVEREELVGVDAALVEYKIGALSKLGFVYAPDPAGAGNRWIAQWRGNVKGTDVTISYGKYSEDRIVGLDIAGQIGDAGLRGELTHVAPHGRPAYRKALLGVDYAFANTLTLSAEWYYSGQSEAERLAEFAQYPQRMQVIPPGGRYAGLSASYEITPLLKASAYFLFNRSDHSRFVAPSLTYLVDDNLTLSGGVQFFSGGTNSEYGRGNTLGYVQLQWFF